MLVGGWMGFLLCGWTAAAFCCRWQGWWLSVCVVGVPSAYWLCTCVLWSSCSLEASSGLVFLFKQNVSLVFSWGGSLSISLPIRELLLRQIYLDTYERGFWVWSGVGWGGPGWWLLLLSWVALLLGGLLLKPMLILCLYCIVPLFFRFLCVWCRCIMVVWW